MTERTKQSGGCRRSNADERALNGDHHTAGAAPERALCRLLHEYRRLLTSNGGTETAELRELQSHLEKALCGHTDDIERIESSLRDSEAQLRQAQKMEAVGCLAGGVAHDFNNVLSVILATADLLLADLPSSAVREDIQLIRDAGIRGARLTRQLLTFSRREMSEPKVVDTGAVLQDVEKMLKRVLGEDIALVCHVPTPAPRVKADPGLLEQVLMNLAVNARDAMPDGGQLEIEISSATLPGSIRPAIAGGSYAVLTVSDTGIGMDSATQARIFEPFFTTKDPSRGTGLGLSTVFGIVKQSGGRISVFSEAGRGTRFTIHLPSVDADPDAEGDGLAPSSVCGTETILLVEDEDSVRTVASSVLRRHGYKVIEASNAGEALIACEKQPSPIHLLLTDVVLSRMSGPELAERLSRLRPDMKVLFMSGHARGSGPRASPPSPCLQKPLTVDALTHKVREALDARHALEHPTCPAA